MMLGVLVARQEEVGDGHLAVTYCVLRMWGIRVQMRATRVSLARWG